MQNKMPVVVIVGAGFGGLRAAQSLRGVPVKVILVNRRNYHLFQPLLYQVATAALSATDIAYPVRTIFRKQGNFEFRMAEVLDVDIPNRSLETSMGSIHYDYLILAIGSETNYYGLESIERHGFQLKDLDDAIRLRNHILGQFEIAAQEGDPAIRREMLTFTIVGGGPTGVEFAGALSELIRLVHVKDFRNLDADQIRVILLEAQSDLLLGFPVELRRNALATLRKKGVEVRFNARVVSYDGQVVVLQNKETIFSRTLVWTAGVQVAGLGEKLNLPQGPQGRIIVEPTLQLPDYPQVYVIGDAAYIQEQGEPLPMMAPVAIQQGELAAHNILRSIEGLPLVNFRYKDPGSLATIGRSAAVARLGRYYFHGLLAWILWLIVHLIQLIGFRNRLLVLINWAWNYIFYESGVRLIIPRSEGKSE